MKRKEKFVRGLKDYLWIIVGSLITAAAINIFLVPYKIAPGGVTGIATVIYYLSGERFQVGTVMLILNVPLFLFGMKFIGRRFTVRTLFSTILLSVIVDVAEPLTKYIIAELELERLTASPDYLLYAVFGGFFMGLGLGFVFKSGATTGGTDLAARIVHHFNPSLSMGKTLLFIDSAVIVFAAVAFKSFLLALYSVLSLYISSKIIDVILEGVNFAKSIFIVSDFADSISQAVMNELDRGVTALKGLGMYTGNEKKVLYCVIQRGQLAQLKEIVKRIDPSAFIILNDVTEVLGEGFKTYE
ncbi:MAG TPA: YitT family protein [Clostridia bacterium]|nr:YitT family protein [Clostridia bacterium]